MLNVLSHSKQFVLPNKIQTPELRNEISNLTSSLLIHHFHKPVLELHPPPPPRPPQVNKHQPWHLLSRGSSLIHISPKNVDPFIFSVNYTSAWTLFLTYPQIKLDRNGSISLDWNPSHPRCRFMDPSGYYLSCDMHVRVQIEIDWHFYICVLHK